MSEENTIESAIMEVNGAISDMKKAGRILANLYIQKYGENWKETDIHGFVSDLLKDD